MGLDMYLTRQYFVKNYSWDDNTNRQWEVTVKRGGKFVDLGAIEGIITSVAVWRKANQIHKWFVDNVQEGIDDCRRAYVSCEKLIELRDLCQYVLTTGSKSLAMKLLPPYQGCFFGTYEINEDYWEDLKSTIEQLSNISQEGDYYYESSW